MQKRSIRDSLGKSKKVGKSIQALLSNEGFRAVRALLRNLQEWKPQCSTGSLQWMLSETRGGDNKGGPRNLIEKY